MVWSRGAIPVPPVVITASICGAESSSSTAARIAAGSSVTLA